MANLFLWAGLTLILATPHLGIGAPSWVVTVGAWGMVIGLVLLILGR